MIGTRRARKTDAAAIATIEVETWRAAYAGMLANATLVGMSAERKAHQWAGALRHRQTGVWVWEDDGLGLQGFGHCGRQRLRALPFEGEVTMLYVLPDAQGRGIGRRLLLTMFADLLRRGMPSALVWVLAANPSRFFYQRLGGRLALRRPITVDGNPVEVLGYAWADLAATLTRTGGGRG
ncbi:MAG: GNAT family N-acetyltransferase [Alphaproteobacteria bacterium]|nr:GNAT family N-acetyltransferase [Alphaproteobacteria bacterium]